MKRYDPDRHLGPDHAAVEFLARIILATEPRTYLSSRDFSLRLDDISNQKAGTVIGQLRDSRRSPLTVTDERTGAKCRKKYRIEFPEGPP